MHKLKHILSFALIVCYCFSFQSIIYGCDNGDVSTDVNSRFFHILHLAGEEHKKLGLPPVEQEKDIEVLCEERTFERIRREYKMEEALEKINSYLLPLNRPDMYEFAIEAVKRVFQIEELTPLMGGHVRSYLQIAGIPFMSIYLEEYEKIKSRKTSYIASLNNYPESKRAFEALARDMKANSDLLDSFLKDGLGTEALREEVVEYVKML